MMMMMMMMTAHNDTCFTRSSATLWNALPPTVCDPLLTLTWFRALLKYVLLCSA